jgi:copper(I)-binding protein
MRHAFSSRFLTATAAIALGLLVSGLFAPGLARADSYSAGALKIDHPWARPSMGKTGAAYFTIENSGASDDALTAVEAGVADKVQIHDTTMEGNVMRMRKLDALALPAGQTVKVAPGGIHIMLIGLKAPLTKGETFPMRLVFEKAGAIDVSVSVETPGEGEESMPGMGGMH